MKRINRNLRVLAGIAVAVVGMSACTDDYVTGTQGGTVVTPPPANNTPRTVAAVTVTPSSAQAAAGATVQLAAIATDSAGVQMSTAGLTWGSSNQGVATVAANGIVTGVTAGTTIITATLGAKVDSSTVTVTGNSPSTPTPAGPRAGYYAAPNGTSAGDGSFAKPWDLATALTNNRAGAGDTLWLRGGTYTGKFRSTLSGSAGNHVVIRQYPGERAVIDAASGSASPSAFYVGGSYATYWGFELTNSHPVRTTSSTANNVRPNVVANYASHTKYINMTVHDGGVAFYSDPQYVDVEITGNVIYNNGWQGPDRGHGHAIYTKSDNGTVTIRDNVIFNQYGYGIHLYSNAGSGKLNNISVVGNVSFNNGTLSNNSNSANILFGQGEVANNGTLNANMTYYSPGKGAKNVVAGGDSKQNGSITVNDNYFAGGTTVFQMGFWSSVTMSGNTLMNGSTLATSTDPNRTLSSGLNLLSGAPGATRVFVRPSPHETGRANIVVYNWGGSGSVSVNLNGVVPSGAQYEIRNAQNITGAPVASGTYGGGSVSVPMSGVSGPTPVGGSSSQVPSTGTQFGVFVVSIL